MFAVFDERTQDSGNISYGVEVDGKRYFVKTAGSADDRRPYLDHVGRVCLLRNSVELSSSLEHPTLPSLRRVIESTSGPMLVYDWVEGELVRGSLQRVRDLPLRHLSRLITEIYDLHLKLVNRGWIASDFYDGSMIYDFDQHRVYAVDLDSYNRGLFTNRMGRMFGSTRFMAPEEFDLGATIDERTTVFTLGRTAAVLMSDGSLDKRAFRGIDAQYDVMARSCQVDPADRFQTLAEMCAEWSSALPDRAGR